MDTVYVAASRPPMHILHVDVYLGHLSSLSIQKLPVHKPGSRSSATSQKYTGRVLADIIASLGSSHTTSAFSQTVVFLNNKFDEATCIHDQMNLAPRRWWNPASRRAMRVFPVANRYIHIYVLDGVGNSFREWSSRERRLAFVRSIGIFIPSLSSSPRTPLERFVNSRCGIYINSRGVLFNRLSCNLWPFRSGRESLKRSV